MSSPDTHRQVVLVSRPDGIPQADEFAIVQAVVRPPGPGEVLVPLGAVMRSYAVGRVEESHSDRFAVGERVTGMFGWQEFATVDASGSCDGCPTTGGRRPCPSACSVSPGRRPDSQ